MSRIFFAYPGRIGGEENFGPSLTGRAEAVILRAERLTVVVGSRSSDMYHYIVTVRVPAWRSFFSAAAEGKDAYEERGGLEDQAHDLIKTHGPTPFLKEKGGKEAPISTVSRKRADHRFADGPLAAV